MKKIIYSLMFCLSIVLFTSCDKDETFTDSRVTYYATLELQGDDIVFLEKGKAFVDPGYTSEMQGEDVTNDVVVKTSLDVNKPGVYVVNYQIVNPDGFSVKASRTVMVYDPTPSPIASGYWKTTLASHRINAAGSVTNYGNSFDVVIIQVAPGEFFCGDFLGGYYGQRAGYGSNYDLTGHFTLNADNTITENGDSFLIGWGDSLDGLTDGKFDPATGEISWNAGYAGMNFYVTFNK